MQLTRLFMIVLSLQIMSCGMSRQYTTPYAPDGTAKGKVASVGVEGCFTCWGQGKGEVTFDEVKINISSSSRCMMWILVVPLGWGECDRSNPSHSDGYWVNTRIKNMSADAINFNANAIRIMTEEDRIAYELQALQIISNKEYVDFISNDNENISMIMPGDEIYFRLFIGSWKSISDEFQLDLSEALTTKDKINLNVKRFTATRFGLIGLH